MIRTAVTVLALCAFLAAKSSAGEPPPEFNSRVDVSITGSIFLIFKTWPLSGELVEVLEGKLENAGYFLDRPFPNTRSWYVRPRKWPGPGIRRLCSELMLDERIRSVLERCELDLFFPIASQAKRNLSSRSGIGGVLSATSTSLGMISGRSKRRLDVRQANWCQCSR